MGKLKYVVGLIISISAIVTPFIVENFSATDYSLPVFYIYRFRFEILIVGIVAFALTFGGVFAGLVQRVWANASKLEKIAVSSCAVVWLILIVAFSWGDASRYVVERGRYIEGEMGADYRRFLVLVGDAHYLNRQMDLAIRYWKDSGDTGAAKKAEIAEKRQAISSVLLDRAQRLERASGRNIQSYKYAIQAIYLDPENVTARSAVTEYIDKLDATRSTACAERTTETWIALGYVYSGAERCPVDGSIYDKWYIEDTKKLLAELQLREIERDSLFDILRRSEINTISNARFSISEAPMLSRLPRRVFNLGRPVKDYIISVDSWDD